MEARSRFPLPPSLPRRPMPPRPRYSVHPSLARMRGSTADAAAYLRDAPSYVDAM